MPIAVIVGFALAFLSFIVLINVILLRLRSQQLRKYVDQWAQEHNWRIISLERASLFNRGPYLMTWRGGMLFRVCIRTEEGRERSGYLGVRPASKLLQNQPVLPAWDDEAEEDGTPPDGGIPHLPRRAALCLFAGVWLGFLLGALLRPLDFMFLNEKDIGEWKWGENSICSSSLALDDFVPFPPHRKMQVFSPLYRDHINTPIQRDGLAHLPMVFKSIAQLSAQLI